MTTLLYALGLDDESILSTFYKSIRVKETKLGWKVPFIPEKMRGMTPHADLVDAKSGEVVIKAGEKITAKRARELAEEGLKEVLFSAGRLAGKYLAEDIVNMQTGEIFGEGDDTRRPSDGADIGTKDHGDPELLHLESRDDGAFIRNTLHMDKVNARDDALIEIYRRLRPSNPPTLDSQPSLFNNLFFNPDHYEISSGGRPPQAQLAAHGLDVPLDYRHPAQGRHSYRGAPT